MIDYLDILKEMRFLTVQEMCIHVEVMVDDGGAIEMLKVSNTHGEVHLLLVHVVSEAEVLLALGDGVEPEDVEGNVEDGGGVEPEGVEANVQDGGGVGIGEHHGMEGVVGEDDEEDEGHGGQGIGPPIHEDMKCDNDGGHVSENSS